ncbi:MAG: amino acid ABC transporter substrate-binding protein [Clostridiales bacterium]|nr:amino acid ABC transporter substrate-binding protein [Clostridiales bacterium]
MKKKIVLLLLSLLILLTGCSQVAQPKEKKSRLDIIKEKGVLEVATEPYFAPNEFIDPSKSDEEKYVGSDIELAKYIAEALQVEVKIVPLEFSAVLAGVAAGKYDMAISSLAYTPEREKNMTLSKGYYFSKTSQGHGMFIRKEDQEEIISPDSLSNKRVVVQSGSLQEIFVNEQIPSYQELKRVSSTMDGYMALQENKVDVSITSIDLANLYLDANPDCGLMVVEGFRFVVDEANDGTRIAMPPGETELKDYVDGLIDQLLSDGQYEKWYNEYAEYARSLGL